MVAKEMTPMLPQINHHIDSPSGNIGFHLKKLQPQKQVGRNHNWDNHGARKMYYRLVTKNKSQSRGY